MRDPLLGSNPVPASLSEMVVTGEITLGENDHWVVGSKTVDDSSDQLAQMGSFFHTRRFVPPGTYTQLHRRTTRVTRDGEERTGYTLVMSDTPDELKDHWDVMSKLRARQTREEPIRVLINGLGLGCVLRGALAFKNVERIDVVELSQDLVDLMTDLAPWVSDPRVRVHVHDALTMRWPTGTRWHVAWHDIWDELSTDNLSSTYARLNRMYGRRTEWQGAWGQEFLRYERDRAGYW